MTFSSKTLPAIIQTVNHTDRFFVYYFSRDRSGVEAVTGGYYYKISDEDLLLCDDPASLTCDNFSISIRNYLFIESRRGPDDNYILAAFVILLQWPEGVC